MRPWARSVKHGALRARDGAAELDRLTAGRDGAGVEALRLVRPRAAVPIHYDDYPVFKSPLDDFLTAVASASLATEVHVVPRGESHRFVRASRS